MQISHLFFGTSVDGSDAAADDDDDEVVEETVVSKTTLICRFRSSKTRHES